MYKKLKYKEKIILAIIMIIPLFHQLTLNQLNVFPQIILETKFTGGLVETNVSYVVIFFYKGIYCGVRKQPCWLDKRESSLENKLWCTKLPHFELMLVNNSSRVVSFTAGASDGLQIWMSVTCWLWAHYCHE